MDSDLPKCSLFDLLNPLVADVFASGLAPVHHFP